MIYRELSPYFIWKEQDSRDMGIYISELPAISRPKVRSSQHTLVGRSGTLTTLEGEDIYDSYSKQVKIVTDGKPTEALMDWLNGGGEVVFSNEPNRRYFANIFDELKFQNNGGSQYYEGQVSFYVHPYKGQYPEEYILLVKDPANSASLGTSVLGVMILSVANVGYYVGSHINESTPDSHSWVKIKNPGNVKAFPIIHTTLGGTVSLGVMADPNGTVTSAQLNAMDLQFTFKNPATDVSYTLDSENRITYTDNMYVGNKTYGSYISFPPGDFYLVWSNTANIVTMDIYPRWRWA